MARYVEDVDRHQVTLLPECLEDYIAEDNTVRVVEAFVEELDLVALGFARAAPADTGRPAYHPAAMLKIFIYRPSVQAFALYRQCPGPTGQQESSDRSERADPLKRFAATFRPRCLFPAGPACFLRHRRHPELGKHFLLLLARKGSRPPECVALCSSPCKACVGTLNQQVALEFRNSGDDTRRHPASWAGQVHTPEREAVHSNVQPLQGLYAELPSVPAG